MQRVGNLRKGDGVVTNYVTIVMYLVSNKDFSLMSSLISEEL